MQWLRILLENDQKLKKIVTQRYAGLRALFWVMWLYFLCKVNNRVTLCVTWVVTELLQKNPMFRRATAFFSNVTQKGIRTCVRAYTYVVSVTLLHYHKHNYKVLIYIYKRA